MEEQKSFKWRVKEMLIYNACSYKKYYVDYEYLICSKAFEQREYCIVDAYTFFEKCFKGTLEETDFDFCVFVL